MESKGNAWGKVREFILTLLCEPWANRGSQCDHRLWNYENVLLEIVENHEDKQYIICGVVQLSLINLFFIRVVVFICDER